jgi:WXXGXW repeat (2 copies)
MRARFIGSLLSGLLLGVPAASVAQVGIGISINIAPPVLPVYLQPACPTPNYIWTPGFWAWDTNYRDYFWVPGTWVSAPQPGYLWTPGYWGWGSGVLRATSAIKTKATLMLWSACSSRPSVSRLLCPPAAAPSSLGWIEFAPPATSAPTASETI